MDQNTQQPKNPKEINKWALASLGLEMGFIIALPLVAFALGGKWLDKHFGFHTPWFTLIGIILAITSTTIWLTRRFKELMK